MLGEAGEGIGAAKGSPDFSCVFPHRGLPSGSVVENPPANSGDLGSIPGSGRSPGEGHGDPLQYSGLGELHRQTSLVGCRPRDCRVRRDSATSTFPFPHHTAESKAGDFSGPQLSP